MADRPIIFSGPMVRALIEGRKTQTRRIIKNVPDQPAPSCHPSHTQRHDAPYLDAYCGERMTPKNPRGMGRDWHWWQIDDRPGPVAFRLPYAPGDRLYVRETWRARLYNQDVPPRDIDPWATRLHYDADGVPPECDDGTNWNRLRTAIHMPRWGSRLTLTVTDVRVHRLQEISEADAVAEGIERLEGSKGPNHFTREITGKWNGSFNAPTAKEVFADLWNSLHGPEAWNANPWVVALTFTVEQRNIDAGGGND